MRKIFLFVATVLISSCCGVSELSNCYEDNSCYRDAKGEIRFKVFKPDVLCIKICAKYYPNDKYLQLKCISDDCYS